MGEMLVASVKYILYIIAQLKFKKYYVRIILSDIESLNLRFKVAQSECLQV